MRRPVMEMCLVCSPEEGLLRRQIGPFLDHIFAATPIKLWRKRCLCGKVSSKSQPTNKAIHEYNSIHEFKKDLGQIPSRYQGYTM